MSSWKRFAYPFFDIKVLLGAIGLAGIVVAYVVLFDSGSKDLANSTPAPSNQTAPVESEASGQSPFSGYTVVTDSGESIALEHGDYLVAMLSMSCEHCMASVAQLNEYVGLFPEIPVVALCWEPSEGAMSEFAAMSGPLFPMHSLGDNFLEFAELIGSAPPRLSYVRDGVAVRSWDDTMPNVESLIAAIQSFRVPGAKTGGN